MQACFANATLGENTTKQQLAPGNKVSTRTPTVLQSYQLRKTLLLTRKCTCNNNRLTQTAA